jgi:branched-chain amino acid transport system substrate-binding protein
MGVNPGDRAGSTPFFPDYTLADEVQTPEEEMKMAEHRKHPTSRFLLAGAVAAAFAAAAMPALAQEPLKIGFMAELSGPQGALGQDQFDALMMVIDRNGGKLGGVPVSVVKEDSQLKPELAVQLADKLISRENVPIITGITFSNIMMAVNKKITGAGVFLIGSNAGPSPVAGAQCTENYFSVSWQNDQQAEVVGKYAVDRKYQKVVTIAPNYQAGRDFVSGFKRYYDKPPVTELWPALSTQDFSAEIAQIAAAQPDAVFTFLPGGLGINFVKQWAQSGLKDKVALLSASTADGIGLPAMGEAATGMIAGGHWAPDFKNEANQQFVKEFEAKFKRIPSQYAAQSYDAALLLDSAIAKVKGKVSDKDAFRAALKAADFKSVRGEFKFGNNNFPVQDLHVFEAYKDDKGRMTLKTIATPLKASADAYAEQCKMK